MNNGLFQSNRHFRNIGFGLMFIALLVGLGGGFTPTTVAAQDTTGNPRGYCDLAMSGRMALTWDGTMRIWMADELATLIKEEGGTCVVQFDSVVVVEMNSIEGAIRIDDECVKNGNGLLVKGQKFEFAYFATAADGFDLWLDFTTDPSTITNPVGTKCGANGNPSGPQELPMGDVDATPGAGTPDPTHPALFGVAWPTDGRTANIVCKANDQTITGSWDANKQTLYLDDVKDQLVELNKTYAVNCTLVTTTVGWLNGQADLKVEAGTYPYTWNVGTGTALGVSWTAIEPTS